MNTILGELGKSSKFCEYVKSIENKKSPIAISGLTDVGMVQIETAIHEFGKRPICIITYNEIQAKKISKLSNCYVNSNGFKIPSKFTNYANTSITESYRKTKWIAIE